MEHIYYWAALLCLVNSLAGYALGRWRALRAARSLFEEIEKQLEEKMVQHAQTTANIVHAQQEEIERLRADSAQYRAMERPGASA